MSERGEILARYGRAKVREVLGGETAVEPADVWCKEHGATFVTLRRNGRLQGCIGTLEAARPIVEDVGHNAVAAATRDPRTKPIVLREVDAHDLEVSILSTLEPIERAQIRPGTDGVVIYLGERRVTFLPVMWETFPEIEQFLGALMQKAGLPRDFWNDEVRIARYTVDHTLDPAPR